MNILNNQRGFMLLNVLFLTLITALAATILMDAAPRIKNPQSVLRLTAVHLANKQFAILESKAARGESLSAADGFQETSYNLGKDNPVVFNVKPTEISGAGSLRKVTVTVTIDGDESFELVAERTIPLVPD